MLLGGLTAADQSRTDIRVATARSDRAAGTLPTALHDTAAVTIGRSVYLFGGGTGANTQSDEILAEPVQGGAASVVGRLPSPSSDQAAAALGGTAYVFGGYTGSEWLDSIVAWRPGRPARVVAHLPEPLRYAAVAATGSSIVISGRLSRKWHSERHGPRVPALHRTGDAARAPAGADDPRGCVCSRRRGLRDRWSRRSSRDADDASGVGRCRAASNPRGRLPLGGPLGPRCGHRRQSDPARGRARSQRHRGDSERARSCGRPVGTSRRLGRCLRSRRGRRTHGRRPLREAARLCPEQRERHGRRHRPAHLQGRRALRGRPPAPARRARLGSEEVVRDQRPRKQRSPRSIPAPANRAGRSR